MKFVISLFLSVLVFVTPAYSESPEVPQTLKPVQPYRTFITVQRYTVEQNGEKTDQVSNIRLEIAFPNGSKVQLPENGQYWPIGNGQYQEINRTFELPFSMVRNDSFQFRIQMIRHGGKFLPCEFDVTALSQFNRTYICHTDVNWQTNQKIAAERIDKEGVQIRVFTDRNSQPKEIPENSIALRE